MRTILLAAATCLAVLPSALLAQVDVGPEFRVNTYTTGQQTSPSVAADAHGNFVVVWTDTASGIVGRRFTSSGEPRGEDFLVRASTTGSYPGAPVVASSANGSFVVVWYSGGDGNGYGVFGQRFDAAGAPAGGMFTVNTYTTGNQALPDLASDANGNFVVVWQSAGQDGREYGIFGRRYDAAGAALGGEFLVNSYTMGYLGTQMRPSVDTDANGNFVVAWLSSFTIFGPSTLQMAAQRYDSAGAPQGSEFSVTEAYSSVGVPQVAKDGAGNFMVAWSSASGFPIPSGNVFGRFFNATGTAVGDSFRLNTNTVGSQGSPAVDADHNGNFIVSWESRGQEGPQFETGVYAQRFNAAGVLLGNEFIVNSHTTGSQRSAAVASTPDENFVVVWQSDQSGPNDVFGQRFGDLIFQDGFESGGVARWSAASTDGDDLGVSDAAALSGSALGLEAFVDDTNAVFVQDDTPTAESRYRARFYFDPNGFDPGESQAHLRTRIFIAFDGSNRRAVALVLRRRTGDFSLMARVRRDDGTRADTGFFSITDEPHIVEIDWNRSSAPGAGDGVFRLFIDDVAVSTLSLLDIDDSAVERVRLGALSLKPGAQGTLFYDQFVSRRQNFIGAE